MQFSLRWLCIPFDEALPPFEQFYVPNAFSMCEKSVRLSKGNMQQASLAENLIIQITRDNF